MSRNAAVAEDFTSGFGPLSDVKFSPDRTEHVAYVLNTWEGNIKYRCEGFKWRK